LHEMLLGLKSRHEDLEIPMPEMFVADNCCHVRTTINGVFPDAHVALDVFHLLGPYLAVVINGTRNPLRGAVAKDVVDAILKNRAGEDGYKYARYRDRAEQEQKLQEMFDRWARKGKVWSQAAAKVHADQLEHVRKGCLERTREDLACDGSRIEGSHKSWNSIMHSYASGIEVFTSLGHDLALRRNLRRAASILLPPKNAPEHLIHTSLFATSLRGLHHVRLAQDIHKIWNNLVATAPKSKCTTRPLLRRAAVYETFGLVPSEHNATFGGLLQMKEESDDEHALNRLTQGNPDELSCLDPGTGTISYLNIDPSLLDLPLPPPSESQVPSVKGASSLPSRASHVSSTHAALLSTGSLPIALDPSRSTDHASANSINVPQAPDDPEIEVRAPQVARELKGTDKLVPHPNAAITTSIRASGTLESFIMKRPEAGKPVATNPGDASNLNHAHDTVVATLSAPLKLSFTPSPSKLTPSERLFHITTSIDPKSLRIGGDTEFYAFMDLRASEKWASFSMTSRQWVKATAQYNTLLAERCRSQGIPVPSPKHPRALVDKLSDVEATVIKKISLNDFKSKQGSEEFWKKHCTVISLVKADSGKTDANRRAQTCSRCKQLKYPGGLGSAANHKKKHCSDGVRCGKVGSDTLPDWPQPPGIFSNGSAFHAVEFLKAIRDLHEKTITNEGRDLVVDLEYLAFAKMFHSRTFQVDPDGPFLFRLFDYLTLVPPLPDLVVTHNGLKHLRLDCLA
ncbi:hypothetical protein C8T65DRAFT_544218, partial [Cerioporus squamosus]